MGIEPRLQRSLFCRKGSFPRVYRVISACGGKEGDEKREEESVRAELRQPCPSIGNIFPWRLGEGGSVCQSGEWHEVRCLLCQGKMSRRWSARAGLTAATLWAYISFLSTLAHAQMCQQRHRHHKSNKMNRYMLQF